MEVFVEDLRVFLERSLDEEEISFQTPLPISVSLSMTDSRLVPLAKLGFSKLPLPIQNILLAMVEFESAKYKAIESTVSRSFQHTISELDMILTLVRRCTETLQRTKEDLLAHARPLWYTDLKGLGDPFSGDNPWTSFETALDSCRKTQLQKDPAVEIVQEEPDLSTVTARLELSRAYRQKAHNLSKKNFEKISFPDIPDLADTPMKVKSAHKHEFEELCKPLEALRRDALKLWTPYKISMQSVLSKEASLATEQIRTSVKTLSVLRTSPLNLHSNDLLEEYRFALQTFPCDSSMVKTCLTVSLDGCKLGHTRKILELKTELTTQFQIRLKQYRDALAAYQEACIVPLV